MMVRICGGVNFGPRFGIFCETFNLTIKLLSVSQGSCLITDSDERADYSLPFDFFVAGVSTG
jgi:hypothetical protein